MTVNNIKHLLNDDYKKFEFSVQPITKTEINRWRKIGYTHNSYAGMMYDNRNPMPDWVHSIGDHLGLLDATYTFYRMNTLDIMPPHVDHFNRYRELFCDDLNKIKRAIVFLEDWKPGHYFELNKKAIVNWSSGDYVMWDHNVEHAASNIGVEPRYTLQITGHV
jgi:hypothetical protein